MTIRTRFAPSPTGYLHIGGVRTALFNWLFTRRHGGQFILRIDDTDADRNRPEALQPILDGFRWLGLDWDEGPEVGGPHAPYFQSQRKDLYRDAVTQLLASGHVYPCYATKDELDAQRKQAEAEKRSFICRGQLRDTADNTQRFRDAPTVLRLKVPVGQQVVIHDKICGDVTVSTDTISDPVVARADGSALYNFATVVDDVAMQITHIIRAREHLSNTPTQVLLYQALGAPLPVFAHVPVVNAPNSKEKLSKRKMQQFMTPDVIAMLRATHAAPADWTDEQIRKNESLNPATVAFYRSLGYLPEGLVNYFGRLGWSLDDRTEIMPLATMLEHFSLERVNDSPASFDPAKLLWVAGETMKSAPLDRKVDGVIPVLQRAGLLDESIDDATRAKLRMVVEACADRLKVFSDVIQYGAFFFRDPQYDAKAVKQRLHKEGMPALLRKFADTPAASDGPFDVASIEADLVAFKQAQGIEGGDINHALRVATTGVMVGPGVFEILAILGRAETRRRIELALALPA